jgi:hypothetical protein
MTSVGMFSFRRMRYVVTVKTATVCSPQQTNHYKRTARQL